MGIDKKFVNCPVCEKILFKGYGQCTIELSCTRCSREIVALLDDERVMMLENRRGVARTQELVRFELASRKLRARK